MGAAGAENKFLGGTNTQSVACGATASATAGSWLEVEHLRPHPRTSESAPLETFSYTRKLKGEGSGPRDSSACHEHCCVAEEIAAVPFILQVYPWSSDKKIEA
ncbi:uncharacterized protein LOC128929292 isoform X2 [Callithrix jacchus]